MKKRIAIITIITAVVLLIGGGIGFKVYYDNTPKGMFYNFLNGHGVEAVSDIDLTVSDCDKNEILDIGCGDSFSIDDIKEGLEPRDWEDGKSIFYTILYEETNDPVLAVMIPYSPDILNYGSHLLLFVVRDGNLCLTSYEDGLLGNINLTNNGFVSIMADMGDFFGAKMEGNYIWNNYSVNKYGQLVDLFSCNSQWVSVAAAKNDGGIDSLFAYYYSGNGHKTISEYSIGAKTYYYFEDGEAEFIALAAQKGYKLIGDEAEMMGLMDDELKNMGYDVNMEYFQNIEDDYVDWDEIDFE